MRKLDWGTLQARSQRAIPEGGEETSQTQSVPTFQVDKDLPYLVSTFFVVSRLSVQMLE